MQRTRTLANAATDVVVATVAWAEPAVVLASLADRDTTKVRAHTNHDKPLRTLCTVAVCLRVTKAGHIDVVRVVNLLLGAVAHKDWLTAPLDNGVLAERDVRHVNFNLGKRQNIARSTHSRQEVGNRRTRASSRDSTKGANHKVRESLAGLRVLDAVVAEVRRLKRTRRGRESALRKANVGTRNWSCNVSPDVRANHIPFTK